MTHYGTDDTGYLFIAGTTKAATSSLFSYLAAHPEVCAANIKETRFFLDADYPQTAKYRYEDGLDKYELFFNHCAQGRVRVEATPDYLYSPGTPRKMCDSLRNIKVVFSLRDPVSRLKSWFRFARQIGAIGQDLSFEEYVREQTKGDDGDKPPYMRALEQGKYSGYLERYLEVFGPERIHIVFYDDLSSDPLGVIKSICEFAGIDPGFYGSYRFEVFNRTENVRSPGLDRLYRRIRFTIRRKIHDRPGLSASLRRVHSELLDPLLARVNIRPRDELIVSPRVSSFLESYYGRENEHLERLFGRALPWSNSAS